MNSLSRSLRRASASHHGVLSGVEAVNAVCVDLKKFWIVDEKDTEAMKAILTEIVNRLADLGASVDAMELELVESGVLTTDAIGIRFPNRNANMTHLWISN